MCDCHGSKLLRSNELPSVKGARLIAVLASELLDFVSAEAAWLSREIPGFADALSWPAPAQTVSRG